MFFLRRFLKRNRLSFRRITRIERNKRSDVGVFGNKLIYLLIQLIGCVYRVADGFTQ